MTSSLSGFEEKLKKLLQPLEDNSIGQDATNQIIAMLRLAFIMCKQPEYSYRRWEAEQAFESLLFGRKVEVVLRQEAQEGPCGYVIKQ